MKSTISLRPAGTALNFRFIIKLLTSFVAEHYVAIAAVSGIVTFVAYLFDWEVLLNVSAMVTALAIAPEFTDEEGGEL